MNRISFTLEDDKKVIYNDTVEYNFSENYYNFKINEDSFFIKLVPFFYLKKVNSSHIFELQNDQDKTLSKITLIAENLSFDINVSYFKYEIADKKHIIKYSLESDEEKCKKIVLFFK